MVFLEIKKMKYTCQFYYKTNIRSRFGHDDQCCEQKLEHYLVKNGSISDEFQLFFRCIGKKI
jgi:ADP-ribosylglycohydrolase